MDPRHPEKTLPRMKELIAQYERVEEDIKGSTTSNSLAQFEREGSLVVQEICLTAPRLHEQMIQTSRNRRTELASGVVSSSVVKENLTTEKPTVKENMTVEEKRALDIIGEENIGGESVSLKDVKAKKPAKKKPAKKVKNNEWI